MTDELGLNARTWQRCQTLSSRAGELRISCEQRARGAIVWDFGNRASGGLSAGLELARCCMADLARITLVPDPLLGLDIPWAVQVSTDAPVRACMSSQYAGWKLAADNFFAMGSGPMRAKAGIEDLFQHVPRDRADRVVGILETGQQVPEEIIDHVANQCDVTPDCVTLLVARTASLAGTIQVVARSVETTLHKLFDLKFDLSRVVSGLGTAPLPPVAKDDMAGIGRTNDAILYGARVTLWVTGQDDELAALVHQIPSSASRDFGRPFGEIFANYNYDFYQIDPHLFSPAQITLMNVETGRTFSAGEVRPELLRESFGNG